MFTFWARIKLNCRCNLELKKLLFFLLKWFAGNEACAPFSFSYKRSLGGRVWPKMARNGAGNAEMKVHCLFIFAIQIFCHFLIPGFLSSLWSHVSNFFDVGNALKHSLFYVKYVVNFLNTIFWSFKKILATLCNLLLTCTPDL